MQTPEVTRVRKTNHQIRISILAAILMMSSATRLHALDTHDAPDTSNPSQSAGRSIEDLNLIGSETAMPPFAESPIDINSGFRQDLFSEGVALRGLVMAQYAQNTLQAPVPPDQQSYVGEHPFGSAMTNWTLTADLRQLHLEHTQFYVCGVWNWVSWNPAGPKAFQIYGLYLYKAFANKGVEIKAGYIGNNLEVIGLTVGGSTATGAQGVYAVLPFELGLSYFPLTTPSFNLRIRGPKNTYLKTVAQRSLDPEGGPRKSNGITQGSVSFRTATSSCYWARQDTCAQQPRPLTTHGFVWGTCTTAHATRTSPPARPSPATTPHSF